MCAASASSVATGTNPGTPGFKCDNEGYSINMTAERQRLEEAARRQKHWRRWGPFLSERQWGTVREDYSPHGTAWDYFPHDDARSRVYRWGEDGIAGWCDNHQRLCFGLALWNGRDPILKERLFGVTGQEGNHGEDAKEIYYYLDATPTYSYAKCLYKYPQSEFPYARLREEARRRGKFDPEFEIHHTGCFDGGRYFDVFAEYAKSAPDDFVLRITAVNRGPEMAELHILPTFWFRNTWSWGRDMSPHPRMSSPEAGRLRAEHPALGTYSIALDGAPRLLFTENETNTERLFGFAGDNRHYKDAFHNLVIHGHQDAVRHEPHGTKACGWYEFQIGPGEQRVIHCRVSNGPGLVDIEDLFERRVAEANEFYSFQANAGDDARSVQRQAFAGLLWSKQFYHFVVEDWLKGDPAQPPPPADRKQGRNKAWVHLYTDDVLSMPDKWEYPWFAAWDTCFHMIAMSLVDPESAKRELGRFLREWYMHPNGQIPAYEWAFGDVNPPVHAWAVWRVYKISHKLEGKPDHAFLESSFHKLMMNFTWWVNRKDSLGDNVFEGGFLGLDNIGVFDRSAPLPTGGSLEQSDGTSWMAMYSLNMLRIALELAFVNPVYEDVASKFFEHFLYIADAMNTLGGTGLWDEADGFYYDRLHLPDGHMAPMKVRSMVGLIPLFAVDTIEPAYLEKLPGFRARFEWFIRNRPDLCNNLASMTLYGEADRRLLSICHGHKLRKVLGHMLNEAEFLSPHGIRSLSRHHAAEPYVFWVDGSAHRVDYEPAESRTGLFGGNSNWRGPVWFPVNYLMIESLQRFNHYYGHGFQVEFPTGSGRMMTLGQVATELSHRLTSLFLRDSHGRRPVYGVEELMQNDPHFRDHILFYEYFHGDNGAGIGASHQTGWTALVAKLIQQSGVR